MAELSRDEAREMRETGRRAMEQVARVAREAASQAGMSRTFARVSKVNADGTLQLELGSDLHPMPLYSVRMTTACAAAQPGDTVVVDTYAHVPLATGVIRTAGSAAHMVPAHTQDASTLTGTLPVANGGTGASSAAEALTALGAASSTDLASVRESVYLNTEALTVGNHHNERLSFGWKQKDNALYVYFYVSGTAVARLEADFPNP